MTDQPDAGRDQLRAGPDPTDDDLGEQVRDEVARAGGPDEAVDRAPERDEPAFDDDEGMQVPPPG